MKPLYEIANEHIDALNKIQEMELDDQTFFDSIDSISGDFEKKAESISFCIKNMENLILGMEEAEKSIYKRKKALKLKVEALSSYLLRQMLRVNIKRIETPFLALSIRNGPPFVNVIDEALGPKHYFSEPKILPATLDKEKIKQEILLGQEIPGAFLEKRSFLKIN